MSELYKQLYTARAAHTKALNRMITKHIDHVSNLITSAAHDGVDAIDSRILLDATGQLLRELSAEHVRFENEMTTILLREPS